MGEARRRKIEQICLYLLLGALAIYFFVEEKFVAGAACVVIAVLNLPLMLLWASFFCTFIAGILCALFSVLWVVPLQVVPVPGVVAGRTLYLHAAACGVVMFALLLVYAFDDLTPGLATAVSLLLSIIFTVACLLAFALRGFIREHVVTLLLLPALKVMETSVLVAPGQSSFVHDIVENIRAQFLSATEVDDSEQGRVAFWTSTQIPALFGTTLDAAYLRHPAQRELPATQQRWVLYFLGNGELFEFMLPELQVFAARSGLNIFVFNFRGVGYSSGHPHCAEDLVHDGVLAFEHLTGVLGARPEHILLFGHSLGGAIAPLVRAETSPQGPIVSERSFSSIGAAARAVLANLCKSITGFSLPLPVFLVQGLLNSVFKGHLDVLTAWATITGPKLIIYHTADVIIPYRQASLHHALSRFPTTAAQSLELGTPGNIDFHNVPLRKYAEYERVLSRCRTMLGLPADLPPPCPQLATDFQFNRH
eukprot:m.68346 g.68346  ORF g.68346 m.68346 type:complete len:479 (+) comp12765_c0_seq1:783-2219(+)